MPNRTIDLLNIRPTIANALIYDTMSNEERFQNTTLRPIVKFQNDLIMEVFKNYITKHKNVFYHISLPKQLEYIENAISKDMKFRNAIKGMIIGQFTIEEYAIYTEESSALNKRIMNLVKERIISQMQVFKPSTASAL